MPIELLLNQHITLFSDVNLWGWVLREHVCSFKFCIVFSVQCI